MALIFSRRALSDTNDLSDTPNYHLLDPATGGIDASELTQAAWLDEAARQAGPDGVLVAVHGYNTSRDRFIERLLDLEPRLRNAGFKGALIGYEWPSLGHPHRYGTDRRMARRAAPFLVTDGLAPLRSRFGQRKLHLLAHSMGCFLTVEALARVRMEGKWVRQMIFTASDVHKTDMRHNRAAPKAIAAKADRFTHYYNKQDEVLAVPGTIINGFRERAGWSGIVGARHASHHDVSCTQHYAVLRRSSGLTGADLLQFSHGWWFEDDKWIADAVEVLTSTPADRIPDRERIQDNDYRIAP